MLYFRIQRYIYFVTITNIPKEKNCKKSPVGLGGLSKMSYICTIYFTNDIKNINV